MAGGQRCPYGRWPQQRRRHTPSSAFVVPVHEGAARLAGENRGSRQRDRAPTCLCLRGLLCLVHRLRLRRHSAQRSDFKATFDETPPTGDRPAREYLGRCVEAQARSLDLLRRTGTLNGTNRRTSAADFGTQRPGSECAASRGLMVLQCRRDRWKISRAPRSCCRCLASAVSSAPSITAALPALRYPVLIRPTPPKSTVLGRIEPGARPRRAVG